MMSEETSGQLSCARLAHRIGVWQSHRAELRGRLGAGVAGQDRLPSSQDAEAELALAPSAGSKSVA